MKANSNVANKSSEIDKSKDAYIKIELGTFLKLMFELDGFPVNVRKINKEQKEFLRSQGEPVDDMVIYTVEKKEMSTDQ